MGRLKLESLLRLQNESGAFHSTVQSRSGILDDWNGFTTALVLRALFPLGQSGRLIRARNRALDFLETCESPNRPGFFLFWPRHSWPAWAPTLPEDADDTSVFVSELVRHGRMSPKRAANIVHHSLIPYRVSKPLQIKPYPWMSPGVFLTWLSHDLPINPVDCCVNTNVVALMAQLGLARAPGYADACLMLVSGVAWARGVPDRLRLLTPYYPDAAELVWALRNAVTCGAESLRGALNELESCTRTARNSEVTLSDRPIFSTADRSIIWTSSAIRVARELVVSQSANS
jgi:hypothetical protein